MWGSIASKLYGSGGSTKAIQQTSYWDETYSSGRDARLSPAGLPHRLDRARRGPGIEVLAAAPERPQVPVQLVEQRDAGRDVEAGDVLVRDAVEVLDQRPQRVA